MQPTGETTRPITDVLGAHARGETGAFDRLVDLVYDDLRRIARSRLRDEAEGHTLAPTGVVHEAYLRLADHGDATWRDRAHFFAFVSRVMRNILVDHARRRRAERRGGARVRVPLAAAPPVSPAGLDLLALNEALDAMEARHERMARGVECRLFGGMTAEETAAALDVSLSTVERDWRRAKLHLYDALAPDPDEPRPVSG